MEANNFIYQRGKNMIRVILVMLFVIISISGFSQTDTEFWFAAPEIDSTHADSSIIRFASINPVDVTVSIPANSSFEPITFHIAANSDAMLDLNKIGTVNYKNAIENTAYDIPVNKGIHIVATDKIEAYYEVKTLPNSEVFALKGKNSLGKLFYANFQNYWHNKYPILSDGDKTMEFGTQDSLPLPFAVDDYQDQVASYSWSSFDIVATEDGTEINITPTNPIVSNANTFDSYGFVTGGAFHPANVTYTIKLNKGQTYSARQVWKNPKKSIGGTKIEVTNATGHNIAVTCKEDGLVSWNHDNSQIYLNPTDNNQTNLYDFSNYAFDVIGDQMIPVNLIGNDYIVMRGGLYPDVDQNQNTPPNDYDYDGERVFFTATANNTVLTIKSYSNTGVLLNTYTSPTLNAGQVYAYAFKYNSNKSNIEQFLRVTSNSPSFYTYHVSGQLSELGSAMIPTIGVCTGSTQLAFTRSYNGLFQVNLMVKTGAEGSFKVYDSKGNDVSTTFNIQASNFVEIPGSGWSVYNQPNNDWTNKAIKDTTYIIKNSQNVFHLGIINISSFPIIDTTRVPQYIGNWLGNPKNLKVPKMFKGYSTTGTIPSSVIASVWNNPNWTVSKVDVEPTSHIYYSITNIAGDTSIYVAHWYADSRGAFYGYFSDFNEFKIGAHLPDDDAKICIGDSIQLQASGGIKYIWSGATIQYLSDINSPNPVVKGMPAGSYTYGVHIEGFCQLSGDTSLSFTVLDKPSVTISGPTAICSSSPIATYLAASSQDVIYTWSALNGNITSVQGVNTSTVNWGTATSGTISVEVDNKACAVANASLDVSPVPLPDPTITGPNTICISSPSATYTVASVVGATYVWNITGGKISSGQGTNSVLVEWNSVGNMSISCTVNNGTCPSQIGTQNVLVNPLPIATISGPISVCLSNPTVTYSVPLSAGATYTWSVAGGIINSGQGTNTVSVTWSSVGSKSISVALDNNSCPAQTGTLDVDVLAVPVATISGPNVICMSSPIATYTVNSSPNATYNWTVVGGTITAGQGTSSISVTWSSAGNRTVSVIVDNKTCTAVTASLNINVVNVPNTTISGPLSICFGSPTATYSVPSITGATYNWTITGGTITSGQGTNSINVIWTSTGNKTLSVDINNTICPVATGSITVNVNSTIDASITGPVLACLSSPTSTYSVNSVTGATYVWTVIGGTITSGQGTNAILVTWSTVGSKSISVTIDNLVCPIAKGNLSVNVNTPPDKTITGPTSICLNTPTATYSVPNSSGSVYTWNITGGIINSGQGTTSVNVTWTSSGAKSISVDIDNKACAIETGVLNVNVNTPPNVNDQIVKACAVTEKTFDGHPEGGTLPYLSHNWKIVVGSIVYSTNKNLLTVNPTSVSGVTRFRYTVTDSNNCSDSSLVDVQIYENPVVVLPDTGVCQNGVLKLMPTITGVSNPLPEWTSSPILNPTQLLSKNVDIITTNYGNYQVTLTATDSLGCKNTAISNVNIYQEPIASVSPSTNTHVCQNEILPLTGQDFPNVVTYKWAGDLASISPNAKITNFKSSIPGNHALSFIVITNHGCSDTAQLNVIVDENPIFTLGADTSTCSGVALTLNAKPTGGSGHYIYDWHDDNGPFDLPHSNNPVYVKNNAGIFNVYLSIIDSVSSCSTSDTMKITVNPNPKVNPIIEEVCLNESKELDGKPTEGSGIWVSHVWSGANISSLIANQSTQKPTFKSSIAGPHYLHYKIVDSKGCIGENNATITVNGLPTPKITGKPLLEVCAKATLPIEVSGISGSAQYTWTGNGAAYLNNTSIQNPTFTTTATGLSQLIIAVEDTKTCIGYDTLTVNVNPLPKPVINNDSLCAGAKINLNGDSKYSIHKWTGDVDPIPVAERTSQNPSFSTTIAKTYNLKYSVTDSKSCTDSVAFTVTVNPLPIVNAGSDIYFAHGDYVTLSGSPSSIAEYNYYWSPQDSVLNPNSQNTYTKPLHSTFTFNLTVENKITLCKDSDKVKVQDISGPLTVSVKPAVICYGDTAMLELSVGGGKQPYLYAWSPGIEKQYSDGSVIVKPSVTTTYTVTVMDNVGAIATATATIVVNQLPTITLADKSVCVNDTLPINPLIVNSDGATTSKVSWTGGGTGGLHGITNEANVNFWDNVSGVNPLKLTVTDSKGCVNSATMNVTVNDLPVITILADSKEVCESIPVDLSVQQTGGVPITNYAWSELNPTHLKSITAATNVFTSDSDGDISLLVTDINGCKGLNTIHIDVNSNPIILAADTAVCQKTELKLDGKPNGGSGTYISHVWSGVNVSKLNNLSIQIPDFNTSEDGEFNVLYDVTDNKGCKKSKPIKITVNPLPTSTYSPLPLEVCSGSPLTITANPQPINDIVTNKWIEPGKPLQGNSATVTIKSDSVGVKKIYYQVITNKGCSIVDTLSVTLKPKPTIKINPDELVICENEIDNIYSVYSGGTNTPLTFTWSTNPETPVVLSSVNTQNTTFVKSKMGSVDVTLIYEDANTCKDTDNVTIQVKPNPTITIGKDYFHACQNQKLQLNANPTNIANRQYTWIGGTGLMFLNKTDIPNPEFSSLSLGKYSLIYQVKENQFGCEAFDTITVNVTASPEKKIIKDSICQNLTLQLDVAQTNATKYIWKGTTLSALSSVTISNPTHNTATPGVFDYNVIETSDSLCSDTVKVNVKVFANPTIQNVPTTVNAFFDQQYKYLPNITPANALYTWSPSEAFIDATIKDAITQKIETDINVSLFVEEMVSGLKCSTTVNSVIKVAPKPTISLAPVTICEGETVKMTPTVTGGANPKTYTWTVDGQTFTGPTLTYKPAKSTQVMVSVNDGYSTITTTQSITVNPKPGNTYLKFPVCSGDDLNINFPSSIIAVKYEWIGKNVQNLSNTKIANPVFNSALSGTYNYKVITTNEFGCADTSDVEIDNIKRPEVSLPDTIKIYNGQTYEFKLGASSINETYEWTPISIFSDPNIKNPTLKDVKDQDEAILKVSETQSGLFCSVKDTSIIVLEKPMTPPQFVVDNPNICFGNSIIMTANVTGGAPNKVYTWTFNGVQTVGDTLKITPTAAGKYTITLKVSDSYDSVTATKDIEVYPNPEVFIYPHLQTYVIDDLGHQLTAMMKGGTQPYSYVWSCDSNGIVSPTKTQNPFTLFKGIQSGNSKVKLLLVDAHKCSATDSINPEIVEEPLWPETVCSGNSFTYSLGTDSSMRWVVTINGKTVEYITSSPTLNFDTAGVGNIIIYDLNDSKNPIYSFNFTINMSPIANFEYTPEKEIYIGKRVQFINLSGPKVNGKLEESPLNFYWDFIGDKVFTSELIEPSYQYDDTGKYDVTLIAMDTISRCRTSVTKKVEVVPNMNCGLKFPNAFTPELIKDRIFLPGYIEGIQDKGYDLKIYNRWGQLLFETEYRNIGWDGIYKGDMCKQDVYVYQCKALCENGKELFINGDVTLIK